MKRSVYFLTASVLLAACGGGADKAANPKEELAQLKKERSALDAKIQKLEAQTKDSTKATPIAVQIAKPGSFTAYVEVQAQIVGDENVTATSQAPGIVTAVYVRAGQQVSKGQTLAMLDAAVVDQQIKALEPQLTLQKSLYEKQQNLWKQNVGTEMQLLQAKTQYEATQKQHASLVAQRNMYLIKSPITGTVDEVSIKEGDAVGPGVPRGIRVVNLNNLKAEASLGENYLGKVKQGNPVLLIFPDTKDTIRTALNYVSQAVDPISRAFLVQIRLNQNKKLHPNMSCRMKIANYKSENTIVVPVAVIQKTAEGEMLYIADGKSAKSVLVETGRSSNGYIEVLSGLKAGDQVIVEGYEDLDNGKAVVVK